MYRSNRTINPFDERTTLTVVTALQWLEKTRDAQDRTGVTVDNDMSHLTLGEDPLDSREIQVLIESLQRPGTLSGLPRMREDCPMKRNVLSYLAECGAPLWLLRLINTGSIHARYRTGAQ